MFMKHYAPNRCEPSIEALNFGGGGDQGRCERVNGEVKFCEMSKKNVFLLGVGGSGVWSGGGQGGYERRIEVFGKIKKNGGWGSHRGGGSSGWRVRADVTQN